MTQAEFIKKYYPIAAKARKGTRIFTSTILTQAAVESGYGTSELSKKANNFFGIKHFGKYPKKYGDYRAYDSPAECFRNYVKFLYENSRYQDAINAKNASKQLELIAQAGYAEAKNYNSVLQNVLENISPLVLKAYEAMKKNQKNILIGTAILTGALLYKNSQKNG